MPPDFSICRPQPKFKEGQQPIQVERAGRRAKRSTKSRKVKDEVKDHDGRLCRYPGCDWQKKFGYVLDAAHVDAAGMGGDPKLIRMVPENLLAMCRGHHRTAQRSMHTGDITVEFRDPKLGTRGMVDFYITDEQRVKVHAGATAPKGKRPKRWSEAEEDADDTFIEEIDEE